MTSSQDDQPQDGPSKTHASAELLAAMGDLLAAVRAARLDFDTPTTADSKQSQHEVADQLSDYILPRLVQLDAPLLAVVGGSTGAGKSTLVNSLVGQQVTEAGILRPTTRSPVLVHHPDDAEWFERDRLLPDLERVEHGSVYGLRLVATDKVPVGLAVLDAPDVDSIDLGNRGLAGQLLSAADLWLFVTSAARYADQVPWDYLRRASERSTSVAVVLDRTADDAVVEVRGHLARMMTARGLSDSPLFTVPESALGPEGRLADDIVAPMRGWLHELAADKNARRLVVGRTLDGAVRHIVLRAHDIADSMDDQVSVADDLQVGLGSGFDEAIAQVLREAYDGSVMSGDVLAQWHEFVGSGDLVSSIEKPSGKLRDRLAASVSGRGSNAAGVVDTIKGALTSLLVDRADAAAQQVTTHWADSRAGRERLDQSAAADRATAGLRVTASRLVDEWTKGITERTRASTSKHSAARLEDGVTAALLAAVLVHAAEKKDGSTVVARGVLNAVFGGTRVDEQITTAADEFTQRATELFEGERSRFADLFTSPDTQRASQSTLRDAARRAEYARHVDFLNGQIAP